MLGRGLSYQSAKNTLAVLRAVLATAVESRVLASNPAAGVKLPRAAAKAARSAREEKRHYLTAGEVNDLATAIGEPYDLLVLTAAYTGCRAGELAGLQVGDVDLLRRRLHVRRAVEEVHGALEVGPPKSGESRTVSLPRFLCDLLASRMTPGAAADEWLFSAPDGRPVPSHQLLPASVQAGGAAGGPTCRGEVPRPATHLRGHPHRRGGAPEGDSGEARALLDHGHDGHLRRALRVGRREPRRCSGPGVVRSSCVTLVSRGGCAASAGGFGRGHFWPLTCGFSRSG